MSRRIVFAGIFGACAALLGFGYYLQFGRGLEPCPMCMMQRLCFAAIAVVALVGALHAPSGIFRRVYGGFIAALAATGATIAGRQIWLQHLPPDRVPECGPGWNYMVDVYPLAEVFKQALRGTGDCAEVSWTFLSLSIAEWSLAWFVALTLAGLGQLILSPGAGRPGLSRTGTNPAVTS